MKNIPSTCSKFISKICPQETVLVEAICDIFVNLDRELNPNTDPEIVEKRWLESKEEILELLVQHGRNMEDDDHPIWPGDYSIQNLAQNVQKIELGAQSETLWELFWQSVCPCPGQPKPVAKNELPTGRMGRQEDLGAITDSSKKPLSLTMQAYYKFYEGLPAAVDKIPHGITPLSSHAVCPIQPTLVITQQPTTLNGRNTSQPSSPVCVAGHPCS